MIRNSTETAVLVATLLERKGLPKAKLLARTLKDLAGRQFLPGSFMEDLVGDLLEFGWVLTVLPTGDYAACPLDIFDEAEEVDLGTHLNEDELTAVLFGRPDFSTLASNLSMPFIPGEGKVFVCENCGHKFKAKETDVENVSRPLCAECLVDDDDQGYTQILKCENCGRCFTRYEDDDDDLEDSEDRVWCATCLDNEEEDSLNDENDLGYNPAQETSRVLDILNNEFYTSVCSVCKKNFIQKIGHAHRMCVECRRRRRRE